MDSTFSVIAAGVLWLGQLLLISGLLLLQCCCLKKKGKNKKPVPAASKPNAKNAKKGGNKKDAKKVPERRNPVPPVAVPATQREVDARIDDGPKLEEEEGRREGFGEGQPYQSLGQIDQNIFAQGVQGAPPPPQQHHHAEAQPAAMPSGGAEPENKNEQPIGQEGAGQGVDYQTWNNLDQDVFVKQGSAPPPSALPPSAAMQSTTPGPSASMNDEPPPRPGVGQGQDYQTWNNLDQNMFIENRPPDASMDEPPPRPGVGQGQDYQTWHNLDQDVFIKK